MSAARYLSCVALGPHLVDDGVLVLTQPADRRAILEHAAAAAATAMADAGVAAADLLTALEARENQAPTGTPEGVAFPHAVLPGLPRSVVVAIRAATPVEFGANRPCDLVFAMFGDANQPWHHVRLLARLARITGPADARTRLRSAATGDDLRAAILAEDAANA
jgi:PTS system nitrogen regulatory IIA component